MFLKTEINQKLLDKLPNWQMVDSKLRQQFVLADFVQAFSFMTQVALVAEKMDHHPEWSNNYKTVVIDLITHDAGCITELDIELASKIDDIFKTY